MTASPPRYRLRRDPEPEPLHKFSSTQINATGRAAELARKLQQQISPADIGAEGIEHQPHVTVFYGIHFITPSARLRAALKTFGPVELTLGKTSLFANDDADVLKVDVASPDLHRLHKMIGKLLPTHETHPVYVPHMTIAYLKPGHGKKYADNSSLAGQKLKFDSVLFSGKRGHMENMPLGPSGLAPFRVR